MEHFCLFIKNRFYFSFCFVINSPELLAMVRKEGKVSDLPLL